MRVRQAQPLLRCRRRLCPPLLRQQHHSHQRRSIAVATTPLQQQLPNFDDMARGRSLEELDRMFNAAFHPDAPFDSAATKRACLMSMRRTYCRKVSLFG